MATKNTLYKCRECGSTNYQHVIERSPDGALLETGQYRCTGCRSVFSSVRAWYEPRQDGGNTEPAANETTRNDKVRVGRGSAVRSAF
jgi:DNA-directed RNA polymerase subunit RPC12/RpoP